MNPFSEYLAYIKKMEAEGRTRKCEACDGHGGVGDVDCATCDGKGWIKPTEEMLKEDEAVRRIFIKTAVERN